MYVCVVWWGYSIYLRLFALGVTGPVFQYVERIVVWGGFLELDLFLVVVGEISSVDISCSYGTSSDLVGKSKQRNKEEQLLLKRLVGLYCDTRS